MSPQSLVGGFPAKTGRSYTDAFGKPLRETLHDAVLGAARGEPDRVRDRTAAAASVRHHREAAQPEQVRAAVRVRVELRTEPPRRGADEEAAELSPRRRLDLVAQRVEELHDRALEELERDVSREPVGDDHVGGASEQVAALDVAAEVEAVFVAEQPVRLERELVSLLVLLADREQAQRRARDP